MANQWDLQPQSDPETIERRRVEVVKLRRAGYSWDAIATRIGEMFNRKISDVQCCEDFRIVMKRAAKDLAEDTNAVRSVQGFRITTAIQKIFAKIEADNFTNEDVESLIKLENRLAKLMGTDMPTKIDVKNLSKPPEKAMTEAELRERVTTLVERISRRQLPSGNPVQPVIDAEILKEPAK